MVGSRMAIRRRMRSRSRLSWAGVTVAPWCLAVSLVVSFVADAGQDPVIGATLMTLTDLAPAPPADIVPSDVGFDARLFHEAHLESGDTQEIEAAPDETEPRLTLKANHKDFPSIDRSRKGDPLVALRPTFDTRLRRSGSLDAYRRDGMTFADGDPWAPPILVGDVTADPPEFGELEPLPSKLTVTTRHTDALASPKAVLGSTTPHVQDGSTPGVARAVSLASTTPAAADETPVEIGALPKWSRGPNGLVSTDAPVVGLLQSHPDYSVALEGPQAETEERCLAEAVYFEARSEPEEGQAAVAQVVLNRVMSGLYPRSVCGVVFQNQQRHNACQFSFACEGRALRVSEPEAWSRAVRIAKEVAEGSAYVSDVGDSTHYHANYVRPTWARALTRMDVIGHHIFYKLKPGQT